MILVAYIYICVYIWYPPPRAQGVGMGKENGNYCNGEPAIVQAQEPTNLLHLPTTAQNSAPYDPSFHIMFHVLVHSILHYWALHVCVIKQYSYIYIPHYNTFVASMSFSFLYSLLSFGSQSKGPDPQLHGRWSSGI